MTTLMENLEMTAARFASRVVAPGFPAILLAALSLPAAHASCGSAFCTLNTDWETHGVWTESGWRGDLRYEYIKQDQPRNGTDRIAIGQIVRDHDEVSTINRNLLASLSYAWSPTIGLSISLPMIERDHHHLHNDNGIKTDERWNFRQPGDARAVAHFALSDGAADTDAAYGLVFGLKLPTGRHDVANAEGEVAERTLQPGTGTTDAIAGAYWRRDLAGSASSVFTQMTVQAPLNARDDYRPGKTLAWDIGYRYQLSDKVRLSAQLNYSAKGRDSGVEAEPIDSGSRSVSLSPGFSISLTRDVQAYAYLQLPLYQNVNGVQLTADRSIVGGVSVRF